MKIYALFLLPILFLESLPIFAQNQVPQITQLSASYDVPNNQVIIKYNLADIENDSIEVTMQVSDDLGRSFLVETIDISGDMGFPVFSGENKEIRWNTQGFINFPDYRIRLIVSDGVAIDLQSLVEQVDSTRLKDNLAFIEGVRHRDEGDHVENIKDSLKTRFESAGLYTRSQAFNFGNYEAHNIEGRLLGIAEQEITYLLDGHFDTIEGSPGADDNGSAIAALLEAARILGQYRYNKTLKFVGFDLEEDGLEGSRQYVLSGGIESFEMLKGAVNLEMIGYYDSQPNTQNLPAGFQILFSDTYAEIAENEFRGNFIGNIANENSISLRNAFDSVATNFVPDLRVISVTVPGNGELTPDFRRSDHAVFWDENYPALMLTNSADFRNPNYHTANDTLGSLNFTFMRRVTQAAIATLATLAEPIHASDAFAEIELFTAIFSKKTNICNYKFLQTPQSMDLDFSGISCGGGFMNIILFDIHGRKIWEQKNITIVQKKISIPIMHYPAGIYFLRLESVEGHEVRKVRLR